MNTQELRIGNLVKLNDSDYLQNQENGFFIHKRKSGFKYGKKILLYVNRLQNLYFELKDKELHINHPSEK
jgi:hypothetical protein